MKTVQTKHEIVLRIQQKQEQIIAFGVRKIGLFGSFVRQEQNKNSDIDVLVEFKGN